jgi:hypothetical protein
LVIFEIKIAHMPEAWWQLKRLYEPVLRAWPRVTGIPIRCCEVVQAYDPHVPFPCEYDLVEDVLEWVIGQRSPMGVYKWRN